MRSALTALLALTAGLALSLACSDDNDGNGNGAFSPPRDDATVAPTMTVPPENDEANDREEFIDTVQAQLQQIETRLTDVEAEAEALSGEGQADAQARLEELDRQIEAIQSDLVGLQTASGQEYEARKVEIEDRVESAMTEAQQLADELGT